MTEPATRVFFSHAHEDKPVVEQIAARVVDEHADAHVWLDTFEITSGESLIERIQDGIDSASRFCVFLSNRSITKPWVRKELNAALALEVEDRPNFVVPVMLEPIARVPLFLLEKKYIQIFDAPESQWLAEFGRLHQPSATPSRPPTQPNVDVRVEAQGSKVIVDMTTRFFTETVSMSVRLTQPAINMTCEWLPLRGADTWNNVTYRRSGDVVYFESSDRINVGGGLRFTIGFATTVDQSVVAEVVLPSGVYKPAPVS